MTLPAFDNPIGATTLGDLLLRAANDYPDTDAIVFPDSRQTYAELVERAYQRARGLQALGVKPGDHVGLLLPTCMEFPEFFFGIALCGAIAVPINARYQSGELAYLIENADLVTIVTTDQIAEHVRRGRKAVQQDDGRGVFRPGLAVEDVEAVDADRLV